MVLPAARDYSLLFPAAFAAAQRLRAASAIALRAAGLILRFGFAVAPLEAVLFEETLEALPRFCFAHLAR